MPGRTRTFPEPMRFGTSLLSDDTRITWTQIAKTIRAKSEQDYETKVKPTVHSGRNKLGSLIESLGRKIQTEK